LIFNEIEVRRIRDISGSNNLRLL